MNNQRYVSTFEEIAEQLNDPDCNEVILGMDIELELLEFSTDMVKRQCHQLLIIYKKLDERYMYKHLIDNEVHYENILNNTHIVPVNLNNQFIVFKIKQRTEDELLLPIWGCYFLHGVLYQLLDSMHQNDWTLPQINKWLENPCFK